MKVVAIILAFIAFVVGPRAAYLWYRASRVQVVPFGQMPIALNPSRCPFRGQLRLSDIAILFLSPFNESNAVAESIGRLQRAHVRPTFMA
jgi:hypothetical protein